MKPRYSDIRFISIALKNVAILVFGAGVIGGFITGLSTENILLAGLIIMIGVIGCLVLFAIGGALDIIMDIEENTRRSSLYLEKLAGRRKQE